MKAKQINKIIDYGIMITGAYFVGSAIFGAIRRKKEGVGKVERIKRRIYKEVSLAQDAGVDFSKKYTELTADEKKALEHVGKDVVGWKQSKRSIESGKPYTESYFGSLRRAWNAVSGIEGIGRAYNVKDANGNICLTWIEDAAAHVEAEKRTLEAEERAAQARKRLQKTRRAMQRQSVTPIAPSVDNLRRDLLNRAKHMQVAVWDGNSYRYIMGDDRYKYLDQINYVVMVHDSSFKTDEITDYPVRSYPDESAAKDFAKQYRGDRTSTTPSGRTFVIGKRMCKVYFIHDVPINKISGIGYAPEVEAELYEIWREQIEYGETEYDYDTWRKVVGDEYAEDVFKYMR